MKHSLLVTGLSQEGLSGFADEDQFVALRSDAAALLWSYRDSLSQWIIPNYHSKPMRGQTSVAAPAPGRTDPAAVAEADAQAKRQDAELTRNEDENIEQIALNDALRLLNRSAYWLIMREFSEPPADDATVTKLLDTFPPSGRSRDRVLEELGGLRQSHLRDHAKLKEKATAALQNAR